MKAFFCLPALASACALVSLSGCWAPRSALTNLQTQNRVLGEQNRAQLAEIENLRTHARDTENRLLQTEQQMAQLQQQNDLARRRLSGYQQTTDELSEEVRGSGRHLPSRVSTQLTDLSLRYPSLRFDPDSGVSKLDTDVLFDSGQTQLTPDARTMLTELAQILQASEAKGLRVMVVGHTDNQRINGPAARNQFPNNFHLSTSRALAVADLLRSQGLTDGRLAVAGVGAHEPVAANDTPGQRQKNRRVEIFIMPPEVPVVGWTDTMPGAYY